MDKTVKVADVSGYRTKSGNIRFVLRDEDGNEYTTFKEEIGRRALELEGRPAGDRKRPIPPDDLYERVKPFEDLVAEDIREAGDE
jgi:hypothetical protein